MLEARASLPMARQKQHFLQLLKENDVVVVSGETWMWENNSGTCDTILFEFFPSIVMLRGNGFLLECQLSLQNDYSEWKASCASYHKTISLL